MDARALSPKRSIRALLPSSLQELIMDWEWELILDVLAVLACGATGVAILYQLLLY